jgi:hypothetical protein
MKRRLAMSLAAVFLPAAVLAGACGTGGTSPTPAGSATSAAAATSPADPAVPTVMPSGSAAAWRSGPTTVTRDVPVPPVPVLLNIRAATHPGYDRIVFDFQHRLPGYEIKYVDQVISDGAGQPVSVPGRRYLQVRFTPAQAHTNAGDPTVADKTKTYSFPMMKGYTIASDFEGVVTIGIGLDDVVGYRVGELTDRIYIDVAA